MNRFRVALLALVFVLVATLAYATTSFAPPPPPPGITYPHDTGARVLRTDPISGEWDEHGIINFIHVERSDVRGYFLTTVDFRSSQALWTSADGSLFQSFDYPNGHTIQFHSNSIAPVEFYVWEQ